MPPQSSVSIWHCAPAYVAGQLHVYALMPSAHAPPLTHGLLAHSLVLVVQSVPVNPALQLVHVAPANCAVHAHV